MEETKEKEVHDFEKAEFVNILELKPSQLLIAENSEGKTKVICVEDVFLSLDSYKNQKLFLLKPESIKFDAEKIIRYAIDEVYQSGQTYENWNEKIANEVTNSDVDDVQAIFDRILKKDLRLSRTYIKGTPVFI